MTFRNLTTPQPLDSLNFAVTWEHRGSAFFSSLKAAFSGPKPAEGSGSDELDSPIRITWIRNPVPGRAITASSLSHVAVVLILLLPIWRLLRWEQPPPIAPDFHLTWDLPASDLPPISSPLKPISNPNEKDAAPSSGTDTYHPRQTILSQPEHIAHPRQTLIEPDAPPTPPKVVPALPNIVQWGADAPASPPKLRIAPSALKPVLQKTREDAADAPQIRSSTVRPDPLNLAQPAAPDLKMPANPSASPMVRAFKPEDAAVPEIENHAPDSAALNVAASTPVVPRPKLQVPTSTARIASSRNSNAEVAAAPEISGAAASGGAPSESGQVSGGEASLRRLIALSATPAPPGEPVEIPRGNLAARISLSPEANGAGAPSGGKPGNGKAPGAGTNGAAGPPGIYVSPPQPNPGSSVSGNGGAANGGLKPVAPRLDAMWPTKPTLPAANSKSARSAPRDLTGFDGEITPEKILSGKRIYTANLNLPNLTSAKGSWILNFAELEPSGSPARVHMDLAAPAVLLTVDPKYPTSLIKQHVEGEVVLYAIIRENGSVDSIQIVKRLDPQLDHNAIAAVAAWKFAPASRNGEPVAVEAVIHIPFNAPPQY